MSINRFFSDAIGIKLHNHVWSWGVYDERNDTVFLKIHDQDRDADYKGWVLVYHPNWTPSPGHQERQRHLRMVQEGAKCFGVCRRTNRDFDTDTFLQIGKLDAEDGCTYAEIKGRVTVASVLRSKPASATSDIDDIAKGKLTTTEKATLVAARIGQGEFRLRVLRAWKNRCAVTGASVKQAIRASHIKAWKDSTNPERLDGHNGLPLIATLDSLFDAHLISFDTVGRIEISRSLTGEDRKRLGIAENLRLSRTPSKQQQIYLQQHEVVD